MSYVFQQPSPYLPPPQAAHLGWQTPSQIHTLQGLAGGSFYWPESPFVSATASFASTAPVNFGIGSYTIVSMSGTENGFYLTTNTPSPRIWLSGDGTPAHPLRPFDIQGMFTDATERVFFMLLQRPMSSPFVTFRRS